MNLFFNELSIHGQFPDYVAFERSIESLMCMRRVAQRFGRDIRCKKYLDQIQVTLADELLPQVLNAFPKDKRSAIFQWLNRFGPFWEDELRHDSGDYFACQEDVVTDSTIGEVAFRKYSGEDARLVSMAPSNWNYSPIVITWHVDQRNERELSVINYWECHELEGALEGQPPGVASWQGLAKAAETRFDALTFAQDWSVALTGRPFASAAADRIMILLNVLNSLKQSIDAGQGSGKATEIISQYFAGGRAWFSDSSETEKNDFRQDLTFPHPKESGSSVFCPWHAKISVGALRLHFTWPVSRRDPLYVVYLGPKITKT